MNNFLDQHQLATLERMIAPECPNVFVCWHKQGTGKTRLALFAFENSGFNDLICVVRRISFDDWIEEIEKCGLDYLVYTDDYTPTGCKRLPKSRWTKEMIGPKRVLLVSGGSLHKLPQHFPKGQMLCVDELYLYANPKAKRSKQLQRISLFCSARLGLSGTLMPSQDNITIYGQMMALQGEKVLARTATDFRTKYQLIARGRFGKEYLNKPTADADIKKVLHPYCSVYFPPTPPQRIQILTVTKTPEQARQIKELKKDYELNGREYKYALQIVNVVNGISNGWFINSERDLVYLQSIKIEKLLALLGELLASGECVVVWCAYHADISRIAGELLDAKIPFLKFTASDEWQRGVWETGIPKVVLATEANGASVNHFRDVKYAIYFSINFKLLDLQQSMMRHERKDSKHRGAYYYFLQTKGTLDARTYTLVNQSDLKEKQLIETLSKEISTL